MSAVYSIYTSPNHAPIPNHLPTLIVTPHGNPSQILYSFIHASYNRECFLLTPSPQGDLCVAKMVPPPGSRGPGGPGTQSDSSHSSDPSREKAVRCEASRNLKWSITNTGIHAPVYKLTLPNPDSPGNEQPLFQISKPNPNATFWTMFYFTYAGHLIPPKRIEFGKIQKNSSVGSGGGGGTRVSITGKSTEEKAVWQTLGEGNEDMVEWIVLCAALNLLDEEIIKAAEKSIVSSGSGSLGATRTKVSAGPDSRAVPSSRPGRPNGGSVGSHSPIQIRPTQGPPPQPFQQRPTAVRAVQNGQPPSSQYSRPAPMPAPQQASYQQRPYPQQQQQQQQQPQSQQGYSQSRNQMGSRPPPNAMPMPQQHQQYQQHQQQQQQQYSQQQPSPQMMPRPQAQGVGLGQQRGYYGPPAGAQRGPPPAVGRQF